MPMSLREALRETLAGWREDLPAQWRPLAKEVSLGFAAIDPALSLEPWEPIFPARRGKIFPGAPAGAHIFRAFDGIAPDDVACVILGQDPYPEPGFATGRAFEAGNVAAWRELDKMFSKSVRAFIQLVLAARTGKAAFARSFADWPAALAALEQDRDLLGPPGGLADRWVAQGALLINSSLTLTRFAVAIDPHQALGHLPLWEPFVAQALRRLAARGKPLAILCFGAVACDLVAGSGLASVDPVLIVEREHPAAADAVLALPNPLRLANEHLRRLGARPIDW